MHIFAYIEHCACTHDDKINNDIDDSYVETDSHISKLRSGKTECNT